MSVGTDLLVSVFEAFAIHDTRQRTFRRLFCESGQAAIKSHRFANDSAKSRMDDAIIHLDTCKYTKLQPRTIVMVFEELTRIKELALLYKMYIHIGGPARKAYRFCNQKTQSAIQSLGLQEMYVKGKSQN